MVNVKRFWKCNIFSYKDSLEDTCLKKCKVLLLKTYLVKKTVSEVQWATFDVDHAKVMVFGWCLSLLCTGHTTKSCFGSDMCNFELFFIFR